MFREDLVVAGFVKTICDSEQGVREFKLLDISENNWAAADSKAFAYYTVQGSLWHKWRNILSTRPYQTRWLQSNATGFSAAFSPQELKKTLDGVNSTAVEFLAPQISANTDLRRTQ